MAPRKSTKSPVPAVEASEIDAPKPVKGKAKPASEPAKATKSPAPKAKAVAAPAVAPEPVPAPEAPAKARSRKPAAPRSAAVAAALAEEEEEVAKAEVAPRRAPRAKAAPKVESVPEPIQVETEKPKAVKKGKADAKAAPAPKAEAKPERRERAPKAPVAASVDTPAIALPTETLPPLVGTAIAAVRAGKAVELIFVDQDSNPPRTFEARQVLFDVFTGQWFLWGWDRRYNAERHHRVDLLAEVNVVEGVGRSAQGPYAEGTPANQIGGWRGGEPIPVKATLQKQWVFAVRQAPAPFPDFVLAEQEDGRALVSFTATDLRAIARWIMQFGDGVTVQEPLRLVDRIKQVAQAWGAKLPAAAAPAPKNAPAPAAPRPQPAPAAPQAREPRPEPRNEARSTRFREHKETREQRESRETETKSRSARVEIRIDRL